jgi:PIN domain nuclease of toxin-antitoxin system
MKILLDTQAIIKIIYSDPFDRLLIAQAINENLTIATTDFKFKYYSGLKIIDVSI